MKEKKKNPNSVDFDAVSEDFLIPATHFRTKISENGNEKKDTLVKPHPINTSEVSEEKTTPLVPSEIKTPNDREQEHRPVTTDLKIASAADTIVQKITIPLASKRVSGLSLSSLKAKKEHQLNKIEVVLDEDDLPNASFTEIELQEHWEVFVQKLEEDGRKILASSLHSDIPKLKDKTTIWIELPNSTMKKEVERDQYDLMEYLKQKLNNYFIKLKISVNEEKAQKYAFTPEEKYQKLREKNPAIDVLKKEFDLDL